MIFKNLFDKIYIKYCHLVGKTIHFVYVPTKQGINYAKWFNLRFKDKHPYNDYVDVNHTNEVFPTVGPVGMWVIDKKQFVDSIVKTTRVSSDKDYMPVKPKWWEGEYKTKIRETVKNAIQENRTIH